ncbi:MAG: Tryptophanyl-tRNA synthetase [Parcubacteria group bacterium GW2011_GWA2_43_9b]|uniref:Tryptophan--tRNA ligase n=1 Tax=Candidatus Portnoybacteria bacterium RIFCSPLOWO2_02_FULL_39_11 TaxID=1802001 RepID=A0A1G2FSV0_9BACT|nr:MAG: Tryptophanyl-tRNA synthetase [Parcubacteria group bacterium GW2011_GWA2_43_9b]OGZ41159.1 MAG: tryptophan--tRNA ligase [Candidatus Portnoybacteria bacterium RIFCSPLOWO2_02_FULL_39_11]
MDKQSENKKKVILTGDRPTGRLHLGHFIGSLKNRVKLQNEYRQFIIIADMQALTDHADNPKMVHENVLQLGLDYLSCGIDPKVSTIFIQSLVPEIAELTMYYLNLVTVAQLERNPTVKDEMKQKGFSKSVPAGFLVYPVSQAADITAFKADLVPVGADQVPVLEQTNEVIKAFNRTYKTDVLIEIKALISDVPRLSGIDGKAKMSKSLNNCIYLSDPSDVLKKKVFEMYTDPGHVGVSDPGKIEGNVVFEYLDAFDTDQKKVAELKEQYQRGGLGDVVVKHYLFEVLDKMLEPIRNKRTELEKNPVQVMKIIKEGTEKARQTAIQTLKEVKEAMGLVY